VSSALDRLRLAWFKAQARFLGGPVEEAGKPLPRTWGANWTTVERLEDDAPLARDNKLSWLVTLAMVVLAFTLRFPYLSDPYEVMFDETYYAKGAWTQLHLGYTVDWPEPGAETNERVIEGEVDIYLPDNPEYAVHPMLGKWLIAVGEAMFGMNPFGWRFMPMVFGCLLVAATVRFARRVSRSTLVGALAGFFVCIDGLAFTMSRIALLDIFQAVFLVAAVACVMADRDWFRHRLAAYLRRKKQPNLGGKYGPAQVWRPWRLLAGVLFGLSCGVKWNSMYVLAVMGIASVVFDWRARRAAGARAKSWDSVWREAPVAFIYLVVVGIVVYTATWASWLYTDGGWGRNWGANNPDATSVHVLGTALASLWHYHVDIFNTHTGDWFANEVTHPYDAHPAGWLFMARVISMAVENNIQPGVQGCTAKAGDTCVRVVNGIGTPFLWWMALIALSAGIVFWVLGRDWRFAAPILAPAAIIIGWWPNADRPLFFFYAICVIPFTATVLAMVLGKILGPPSAGRRRWRGAVIVGVCTCIILADFIFIYPIISDRLITRVAWAARMWFKSWI
jgi:dolichyl-phosphate-mannose--protein O-mannosyl transferase